MVPEMLNLRLSRFLGNAFRVRVLLDEAYEVTQNLLSALPVTPDFSKEGERETLQ